MAKKQSKTAASTQKTTENRSFDSGQTVKSAIPSFFSNQALLAWALFFFSFLLYANTLKHGFVLDDDIVIRQNMYTQEGVKGIPGILTKDTFYGFFKEEGKAALVSGGRYRPFSLVVFALIVQFFGENAFVFHFFTVLLFALTVVVVYHLLLRLLRDAMNPDSRNMVAFLTALLFAAHPIHTEVVANIKGCDEILALLGSLGSLWLLLYAFDEKKFGLSIVAALVFGIGLFSKENAFLWVVLSPIALILFRKNSLASTIQYSAPLWIMAAFFLYVRGGILGWSIKTKPGDMMNNPFLKVENGLWVDFSISERLGTIFYTLGKYVQLLYFPKTLTHDYYPRHVGIYTLTSPAAFLSVLLYIAIGLISIFIKNKTVKYGIWIYLATLFIVSNLLFPVGTNMGERFLFMPSLGFCLAFVAFLIAFFYEKKDNWQIPTYLIAAFVALFSLLTIVRNPAWKSNETLFFTDAKTSVNSAKLQHACGGMTIDLALQEKDENKRNKMFREAIAYLDIANTIHPTYQDARLNRGNAYYYLGEYDKAIADYRETVRIAPNFVSAKNNLAMALRDGGKFYGEKKRDIGTAIKYLNESATLNPKDTETFRLLGVANGNLGNHAEAIKWFGKVLEISPESASAWMDFSIAHSASGDTKKGQEFLKKALSLDPEVMKKR